MENQNPLVSVLIVTWNRKKELLKCLDSVINQTYQNIEIIVVDNFSSDGTCQVVREKFPEVKLIRARKNLGCPSGRNLGFSNCSGEFVYCLDDDGWLGANAIKKALRRAVSDPKIAIVQSQINEIENNKILKKRPDYLEPMYVATFSGGCSLIRMKALEEVGYYPDDFFRQAEEEDLVLRIFNAKYYCVFEPTSVMYHVPSHSRRVPYQIYRYQLCNNMKIGLRLWPFPWGILRVPIIFHYALSYAINKKAFILFVEVISSFIKTTSSLVVHRNPVSREAFKLYLQLKRKPAKINRQSDCPLI